ncbi:MAG: pyrroline-5-carboxylate reductase [Phototrophicales bacterium]|nr:MAG: pyrroline-5-carboxylate reductase [Phototrophicales bacterium]
MFTDKTLAFIGSGQMAEAMIAGLLNKKIVAADQIIASGPREQRARELTARYNIRATTDNVLAAQAADIAILSAKPQMFDDLLPPECDALFHCDFVISIAAGLSLDYLVHQFKNPRVVRAMPNTPAKIGQGITVWTTTKDVAAEQREQAHLILSAFGESVYVDKEDYLDMATALSGTGPAYVFLFIEAMIDAGVHLGFSRRIARQLVLQTLRGSVEYALHTDEHEVALRNQVTSPGGTSAEALYHLERGGFRTVISRAIWAAYQRSVALGGGKKVSQRLGGRPGTELDGDI